jgi:hypothetical protein
MKLAAKAGLLALATVLLSGCDTERLRALREAEEQRAIRNEAGFLAQREAELKQEEELAKGWPQIRPGMTADELGRILPLNFPKATRKAIRSNPAYSITLKGHKLHFRQGVLDAIE